MTDCRTMDPFGRPERAALFGLSAAILIATISGSVWPPRARSVCPPFDTLHLRSGERVRLIVLREPDASRWHQHRIAAAVDQEDLELAESGLADWSDELSEDPGEAG